MKAVGWVLIALLGALLLWTLVLGISALLVDPKRRYLSDSPYYRRLLNMAAAVVIAFCRVRIQLTGRELAPEGKRFLLVSNHRSNFDPILTGYALRDRQISFISKEANFRIPLFGRIIHRCGYLPIDRENPRNAMGTILEAAERMRSDAVSFGVYPEGTRSKTCELLPFHNGVFKIAQRAEAPVLVCAIRGTEQVHRRLPWRHTDVYLDILACIDAGEEKSLTTAELGAKARKLIEDKLDS